MQYSIDKIRSVRNLYTEPPYPGFSLEEVVKRRRATQTKLVRGENAWVAKGTAKTTEEWATRLTQSNLNKLSPKNVDVIMEKLKVKELFASKEIIALVVSMIFEKALNEPENSKLYAALCLDLALFECSINNKGSGGKRQSDVRDSIIDFTREEFKQFRFDPKAIKNITKEDLQNEELMDDYRSNFIKRKRANMRFVGELYLNSTVTSRAMENIFNVSLAGDPKNNGFPESENIELTVELLNTVGEKLDNERKESIDKYFIILKNVIEDERCPYTKRIIFQIMNLLDLRKAAWGKKPKETKTTNSKKSQSNKKNTRAKPAETAGIGARSWREAAKNDKAAPTSSSNAASGKQAQNNNNNKNNENNNSGKKETKQTKEVTFPFESIVRSMLDEWVSHRVNDFITDWMDKFQECDREFANEEELAVAVAVEVINNACLTTRKEAQREAYSFLVVGLFLTDEEIMQGFATAAEMSLEDGLIEDAPKYPERFMLMLRYSSTEEEITADVYYDAATVLIMAYNKLAEKGDCDYASCRDSLLSFWRKVARPTPSADEDDRVILGAPVLYSICSNSDETKPEVEILIAEIIKSLHEMDVVRDEDLEEFLLLEENIVPLKFKVASILKESK